MDSWRGSLVVRPVGDDEVGRFAAGLAAHHWLGPRLSGQVMRYVATVDGEWVALAGFGSAALRCPVREGFLGWDEATRSRRLELVVANQRLCVQRAPDPHRSGRPRRSRRGSLAHQPVDVSRVYPYLWISRNQPPVSSRTWRVWAAPRQPKLAKIP